MEKDKKIPNWQRRILEEYHYVDDVAEYVDNKRDILSEYLDEHYYDGTLSGLERKLLEEQRDIMLDVLKHLWDYKEILGYRLDQYEIEH